MGDYVGERSGVAHCACGTCARGAGYTRSSFALEAEHGVKRQLELTNAYSADLNIIFRLHAQVIAVQHTRAAFQS